ncbi:MAG: 16S rRNA processing protein RimM [Clostridia bacterium]|nr:16S rRNA processing protein RimM [Clostridia bacterium]
MEKLIDVGQIVNTHGLRGEIKVSPRTDYPEFFEEISGVYTEDGTYYKITGIKYHKNTVILKLRGINTVEEAEAMRREVLYVPKSIFDELPDGTYLIADIIGLEVRDDSCVYGKVTDVFQTGSNDVYTVEKTGDDILYLPALKSVIREINIDEGYILVTIPEGLID